MHLVENYLRKSAMQDILMRARFFFHQLISGVSYCHAMEVCHRDLKLENTLLDGSLTLHFNICDFGYSKMGTFLLTLEIADVWSCGVTLFVMLVGSYPFEDPNDPKDFRKTIQLEKNLPRGSLG
ncbi:hypothetical protein GLYMA_10G108000v4 [Glycine max]|uniref:non-specific serine/threonine protein kinase n=1 Tax=Glycine max TaxID=3847 RepID=A0A0R0I021_SOYBN|nr:hypothetical protein GLYMA_10G108000v4 [Glycine max]KAG4397231.1 hypothetical protein GLYMA_10G108000v4 [Glycine max]KAG4397234.1 hypothetical protein GLYMA_10G108000v4 [Glycine max]KAG4397240.1 hypothetical protein GLYMA_10G108000v4 [Glycine max]KRH33221.1 hypothetical protein GLYMA_10G108000v4 [Glycine max]